MTSQTNLDKFNEFYKETYSNILRYIIIKCHNINDVNDIIQDVYLELWKIMNKKDIDDTNINSYLIGIAINKIKKYYSLVMRIRDISLFDKNNNDLEIIHKIDSSFDIESLLIKDEEWKSIWNFIKNKKNSTINVLDSNVKNNDVIIVNNIDNNFDNAKLDIDGRSEDITTDDLYKIYPLLKDIVLPNDYNINGIIKCYLFNDDTGKYDKLYGYNIIYSDGNNKYIDIFILIDTTKRLRCFSIDTDEMKSSIINGNSIKIMGEDKYYYAIFSYNNINFDIETTGISEEEFIRLIKSIIK